MNILMLYNFTPGTTAWYLERALRKYHKVKTCGPCSRGDSYHDIPLRGNFIRLDKIYRELSGNWKVDMFFMVDSAYTFYPNGISSLPIPTMFYAIDTYAAFRSHKNIASLFDLVFVAQKEFVEPLRWSGKNSFWLPLACDPEIHNRYGLPKIYDVCFLGSMHPERKELLKRLSPKFKVYQGYVPFDEVAGIYSQSRIVFNKSVSNDLNMRVFEAMCSGSMLLSDRIHNNGLEDLFQDRKHLVLYNEDNLEELVQHYLAHETEREKIAQEGMACVIDNHTYEHRVRQMLEKLDDFISNKVRKTGEKGRESYRFAKIWFFQSRFGKIFNRKC